MPQRFDWARAAKRDRNRRRKREPKLEVAGSSERAPARAEPTPKPQPKRATAGTGLESRYTLPGNERPVKQATKEVDGRLVRRWLVLERLFGRKVVWADTAEEAGRLALERGLNVKRVEPAARGRE